MTNGEERLTLELDFARPGRIPWPRPKRRRDAQRCSTAVGEEYGATLAGPGRRDHRRGAVRHADAAIGSLLREPERSTDHDYGSCRYLHYASSIVPPTALRAYIYHIRRQLRQRRGRRQAGRERPPRRVHVPDWIVCRGAPSKLHRLKRCSPSHIASEPSLRFAPLHRRRLARDVAGETIVVVVGEEVDGHIEKVGVDKGTRQRRSPLTRRTRHMLMCHPLVARQGGQNYVFSSRPSASMALRPTR